MAGPDLMGSIQKDVLHTHLQHNKVWLQTPLVSQTAI